MSRYLFSYDDSERGSTGIFKAVVQAKNLADAKRMALQSIGYKRGDFPEEQVGSQNELWKELKEENEEGEGPFIDIKPVNRGRWSERELEAPITVTNYAGSPVAPLPKGTGPYSMEFEDQEVD